VSAAEAGEDVGPRSKFDELRVEKSIGRQSAREVSSDAHHSIRLDPRERAQQDSVGQIEDGNVRADAGGEHAGGCEHKTRSAA
jgi:hypothetical protein